MAQSPAFDPDQLRGSLRVLTEDMDRGDILRHMIASYRQHLAAGVDAGVARTYLREIARLETELRRFESEASGRPSRRIEWTDVLSVGHDTIDQQHCDLVRRINQICDALEVRHDISQRHADLRALISAAKAHFEHEMAIVKEFRTGARASGRTETLGEAAYDEHVAAHGRALGELQAFIAKIQGGVPTTVTQRGDELVRWFVDHAIKYDAHLKAVFQPIPVPRSP